jgi:hypothetical protein
MRKIRRKKGGQENVGGNSDGATNPGTGTDNPGTSDDTSGNDRIEVRGNLEQVRNDLERIDNEPDNVGNNVADIPTSARPDNGNLEQSSDSIDGDSSSNSGFGSYRRRIRSGRNSGERISADSDRSAGSNSAETERGNESTPRVIDAAQFFRGSEKKRGRKKSPSVSIDTIAEFLTTTFEVPVYLHWGEHWTLAPNDAKELAEKIYACYLTIPPSKQWKWLIETLEKLTPWFGLALTVGALVYPRYLITAEKLSNARKGYGSSLGGNNQPGSANYGQSGVGDSGTSSDNESGTAYKAPFGGDFGKVG